MAVDRDILAVVAGLVLLRTAEVCSWPPDPRDEGVDATAVRFLKAAISTGEINRVGLASDEHAAPFVYRNAPRRVVAATAERHAR